VEQLSFGDAEPSPPEAKVYRISDLPAQLARRITVDPETGCWLWNGALGSGGYVQVSFKGVTYRWHRLIYTLLVGSVPRELDVDHVKKRGCKYRHCCWPAHLEPVTRWVNNMRSENPTALNAEKTHCPKGHPYDLENTRWYRGRRHCRACNRESWHERRGGKGGLAMSERTHCPQGHEYTLENTYVNPSNNGRVCRICTREAQRRYQARKAAKAT
jgi:hypothetical protein